MRLTPQQQQQIKTTLKRYFGEATEIMLFGSAEAQPTEIEL